MKSNKWQPGSRMIGGDSVILNFSKDQLYWLGAVAMAYNDAETELHNLFAACIYSPVDRYEISSRVNGTAGLVSVIQTTVARLDIQPETPQSVDLMLAAFAQLKIYRDMVIHARLIDARTGYAMKPDRQGVRSYTILTADALKGLYEHLSALSDEMSFLVGPIQCALKIFYGHVADDQHKERLRTTIRDCAAQAKLHRKYRQSLSPLPVLPQAEKPDADKSQPRKRDTHKRKKGDNLAE